eukprot:968414-Pleurochrysis_carterae.AAC.1
MSRRLRELCARKGELLADWRALDRMFFKHDGGGDRLNEDSANSDPDSFTSQRSESSIARVRVRSPGEGNDTPSQARDTSALSHVTLNHSSSSFNSSLAIDSSGGSFFKLGGASSPGGASSMSNTRQKSQMPVGGGSVLEAIAASDRTSSREDAQSQLMCVSSQG